MAIHTVNKLIILSALTMLPLILLAAENPLPIHYRADPKTIIPGKIELIEPIVSIPVSVGSASQSPVIKVMINDEGPFLFALDTGFSETIISKQLEDKLILPTIKKSHITYVTPQGTVDEFGNILLIHKIQINNMTVLDYAVFSSTSVTKNEINFDKRHVDGILSINMFHDVLLTLDYKNGMLHVQKDALSLMDNNVSPYQTGYKVPVVEAYIQSFSLKKDIPYRFMLDTGESGYIYINACTLPVNDLFQNRNTFTQYDLFGNTIEAFKAQLNGNIKLSDAVILNSPNVAYSQENCRHASPIGRFGRSFFERHEVTFDNKNGLVKIN